jgi:hypothetical protein
VACLLTDFFVLPDEDDGPDEEPPMRFAPGDFALGDRMRIGQALRRQSLTSASGRYTLVHQDDGNLVLYHNTEFRSLWASGTDGVPAEVCALHERRGLVLLDGDGGQVWSSGTAGGSADRLVVRDTGEIVVEDSSGVVVWSSGTAEAAVPEGPVAVGDRMLPGQTLGRQSLTSASGRYTFVHQDDGNLVLYDNVAGGAVWSSGTQGRGTARCVLRPDGDLALYDREARVVWSTGTSGHPGSVLVVGDEDGVAVHAPDGAVLWNTQAAPAGRPFLRSATAPSLGMALSPLQPAVPGRAMTPAIPTVPAKPAVPARPTSAATPATAARPISPARPSGEDEEPQ